MQQAGETLVIMSEPVPKTELHAEPAHHDQACIKAMCACADYG